MQLQRKLDKNGLLTSPWKRKQKDKIDINQKNTKNSAQNCIRCSMLTFHKLSYLVSHVSIDKYFYVPEIWNLEWHLNPFWAVFKGFKGVIVGLQWEIFKSFLSQWQLSVLHHLNMHRPTIRQSYILILNDNFFLFEELLV